MNNKRYKWMIITLWSLCLSNSSHASTAKDHTIEIITKNIITKDYPDDKQYILDLFNYFLTSQKNTSKHIETQEERDLFEQRFQCDYARVLNTRTNLSYAHPHQTKRAVLFWAHEESENREVFTLHTYLCKRLLLLSEHYCVDLYFIDSLESIESILRSYHNHEISFLEIGGHGSGTSLELSTRHEHHITRTTALDQSLWKDKLTQDGSIFLYSCLNGADLPYDNLSQAIAKQVRGHVVLGADFSFNASLIETDRKDPLSFRILQGRRDGVRAHYYPERVCYEDPERVCYEKIIINERILTKDDRILRNETKENKIIYMTNHLYTLYND